MSTAAWSALTKGSYCNSCPKKADACLLRGRLTAANLTFVAEYPSHAAVNMRTPFMDRDGSVVGTIWKDVCTKLGVRNPYNVAYAVAAPHGKEPKKDTANACAAYLRAKLLALPDDKHQVIVAFGRGATRALGISGTSIKNMRGHFITVKIGERSFYVMPTLGVNHIVKDPGVFRVVSNDITMAARLAFSKEPMPRPDPRTITEMYEIPITADAAIDMMDRIIAYTDVAKRPNPEEWPIAVDCETTSLYPHDPTSRMIAMSFAWDDGKSGTIYLDHRDNPYKDDMPRVWAKLRELMATKKPKIFHNAKFDIKFIAIKYGIKIENFWWDTLLGEHFLDEDKSGYYGLKTIAAIYTPQLLGYEEALKKSLISRGHSEASIRFSDINPTKTVKTQIKPPVFLHVQAEVCAAMNPMQLEILADLEKRYVTAALAGDAARTKLRASIRRMVDQTLGKAYKLPPAVRKAKEATAVRTFEDVPIEIMATYAAADTDITRRVCRSQQAAAKAQGTLSDLLYVMSNLYVPGTVALANMEHKGIRADRENLDRFAEEIQALVDTSLAKVRDAVCDATFNPNSTDQLFKKVRDAVGVDPADIVYSEDSGKPKMTAQILKSYQKKYNTNKTQTEFFYWLLTYKTSSKALKTYVRNWQRMIEMDGRIHGYFNLNGTATGRLACTNPNLQNIPAYMCRTKHEDPEKDIPGWGIKSLLVPSRPGYAFWQLDISAAEVRVLAAYSKDPLLIEALRKGLDIHSYVASQVGTMTYEEIETKKDKDPEVKLFRTACKRVVFGTLYGAGPRKIAEQIYGELSKDEGEKAKQIKFATDIMNKIFTRFKGIPTHIDNVKFDVGRDRKCKTILGRWRRFNLFDAGKEYEGAAEREGVNFQIQSTASDLVLDALVHAYPLIKDMGGEILITVHDSIAGEIPIDKLGELEAFWEVNLVERVRARYPWMPVDYKFDLEFGPSYGEMCSIAALTKDPNKLDKKERSYMQRIGLII